MHRKIVLTATSFLIAALRFFSAQAQDTDSLARSFLDSASHYESLNKNLQAYNFTKKAFDRLSQLPSPPLSKLARIESDMGTYAFRMGDVGKSERHHRNAIRVFEKMSDPDYECLYLSGTNMGGIMWFSSKIDSALYFYKMASDALAKMDSTPQNRYYRPAVMNNNMAAIYSMQGKATEAIDAMKITITNIQHYLSLPDTTLPKRDMAKHMQFEATDNLAGVYKELGNYRKAHELLMHSYKEKQRNLNAGNPDVYKSEILLGQLYYAMKDYERADDFLQRGLAGISAADGDFLFWQADAYNTLSLMNDFLGRKELAGSYYTKADSLYEASLQGDYDNIYLEFLSNAALFYAQTQRQQLAVQQAMKAYNYVVKAQGRETLPAFYQMLNLSEVYFTANDYKTAERYGLQAVGVVDGMLVNGNNFLDSLKISLKKPKAILLIAKSKYEMATVKSRETLLPLLDQLREALNILEKRKSIIQDASDISLLMADHKDLIEFVKVILTDLYKSTGGEEYLDELLSIHESGLYNRIRARLDKENHIRFAHLPQQIQDEEKSLKGSFATIMEEKLSHDEKITKYLRAEEKWGAFLLKLQREYPAYYRMRYASIFRSVREVMSDIPAATTVVRYIFAGKRLMVLVADRNQRSLTELNADGLSEEVEKLGFSGTDLKQSAGLLTALYNRLWKPVEAAINNRRVIIVPDGVIYNINFELLAFGPIASYGDMAVNTLLARHVVAYEYSLLLLNEKPAGKKISGNFVAFAPGFSDYVKDQYRAASGRNFEIDNFYLSLLPQPFTVELAKRSGGKFGGDIFMNELSTIGSFRKNAGGHRIIHIGTHAEADNLHPQFSRLIFSKDASEDEPENYLYLFDIYNCDLNSDLTVLTACESGKVGYDDGEGMLSLAHAFNYAGSESILMGLWKIDEQTSAELIGFFYDGLQKGLPKDEALRNAKLRYLSSAKGRRLAPQYWAGLVLMGDTSPVQLSSSGSKWWFVGGAAILLLAGASWSLSRLHFNRKKNSLAA